MKEQDRKQLEGKYDILAYGTGIDNQGEYAVFVYRDKTEQELPKKVGKLNVVEKKYTGRVDGLSGFLGEQCSYWGESVDHTEEKYAYPLFKKGQKVIKIVFDDHGQAYFNPNGKYIDKSYQGSDTYGKRYDWIVHMELIETTIVDGIAHNEREGWCYQLDCDEYPQPQTHIYSNIENAKNELRRRINEKINPLKKALEYIDTL